jgi:hypothetical protein
MVQEKRMPPKLAAHIKKLNLVLPLELIRRIDGWRARQDVPPNVSAAIRSLLEQALDVAEAPAGKAKKPPRAK